MVISAVSVMSISTISTISMLKTLLWFSGSWIVVVPEIVVRVVVLCSCVVVLCSYIAFLFYF